MIMHWDAITGSCLAFLIKHSSTANWWVCIAYSCQNTVYNGNRTVNWVAALFHCSPGCWVPLSYNHSEPIKMTMIQIMTAICFQQKPVLTYDCIRDLSQRLQLISFRFFLRQLMTYLLHPTSKNLRIHPKLRSGGILWNFVFRSGQ